MRIIVSGYPIISGATILEKRRFVRDHLDWLRRALMAEPRGHADMYGALLVDNDRPEADLAVLFMHNEGYSTMCGHAVIALGRYAIDYGIVKPVSPETLVQIQCPCGLVAAHVEYSEGRSGAVRFESVPAFAFATDLTVTVEGLGEVKYDIGYGGAFYALVCAAQLSLDLCLSPVGDLIQAGDAITSAVKASVAVTHPESADLAFLYGTILTDGRDEYSAETPSANLCIFADRQADRSPTGSGVTARIAVQFHKKQIQLGQRRAFVNSKVGSEFTGTPVRVVKYGCYDDAVVVEVCGKGHYCGESSFSWEPDDQLAAAGFLLR